MNAQDKTNVFFAALDQIEEYGSHYAMGPGSRIVMLYEFDESAPAYGLTYPGDSVALMEQLYATTVDGRDVLAMLFTRGDMINLGGMDAVFQLRRAVTTMKARIDGTDE